MGRGLFLWVSNATPQGAETHRSPIFGVLLYLCLHILKQNDQIRHGNRYGDCEGSILGGQPRHYICTNASRSLSATAEFLFIYSLTSNVWIYEGELLIPHTKYLLR